MAKCPVPPALEKWLFSSRLAEIGFVRLNHLLAPGILDALQEIYEAICRVPKEPTTSAPVEIAGRG